MYFPYTGHFSQSKKHMDFSVHVSHGPDLRYLQISAQLALSSLIKLGATCTPSLSKTKDKIA